MCVLTVLRLTTNSAAISSLVQPCAISLRISISRGVQEPDAGYAWSGGGLNGVGGWGGSGISARGVSMNAAALPDSSRIAAGKKRASPFAVAKITMLVMVEMPTMARIACQRC